MTDLDIWRSADALMKQHGDDAVIVAALRADEFLSLGDTEGCAVWVRIARAIDSLQRKQKPREGEAVN